MTLIHSQNDSADCYEVGNLVALLAAVSSGVSIPGACYEFIKNLEDEDAKSIEIDCDPDEKRLCIYGDGRYVTPIELDEMSKRIAASKKSDRNHGLGMLSFLRISPRMVMISWNKAKTEYSIKTCTPSSDNKLISDIGVARIMTKDDILRYNYACSRLRKWSTGFVTIIEDLGNTSKLAHFSGSFKIEEEFGGKKFVNYLREQLAWSKLNCQYRYGKEKAVAIKKKHGKGEHVAFKLPSKEYPCMREKSNEPLFCFEANGHHYNLELSFDLWLSQQNEGVVKITERNQDALDLKDAFHTKPNKLAEVFKNPDYVTYLQGQIDFRIKPTDGGEAPAVYNGSRTQLIVDGSFGDCLSNMLWYSDIEILGDKIMSYRKNSQKRGDEQSIKELAEDMDCYFRDHPEVFDRYLQHTSAQPSAAGIVKCKNCKIEGIPLRGFTDAEVDLVNQKGPNARIYALSDSPSYRCSNCGHLWAHRGYTHREDDPDVPQTPRSLPKWREPLTGKVRERKHGYGCTFDLRPLSRELDSKRSIYIGSEVVVNTAHESYKILLRDHGKKGLVTKIYERQMALRAIISKTHEGLDAESLRQLLEDGEAEILMYFRRERPKKPVTWKSKKSFKSSVSQLKEKFEGVTAS
jgi:hypothetical protein